jgi:hypothetical protein
MPKHGRIYVLSLPAHDKCGFWHTGCLYAYVCMSESETFEWLGEFYFFFVFTSLSVMGRC